MGVMRIDGVICDDLLVREVQDVWIKWVTRMLKYPAKGRGSVLIHDDIQMDQQQYARFNHYLQIFPVIALAD